MPADVLARIRELLSAAGVEYREAQHEPTRTSQESARARGEELRSGGKALLLKVDKTYRLFVLSAARKLDSAAVKRHFGVKRSRFATSTELQEMTGLPRGAIPPFGQPILAFELFVDESILENDIIAFNAGSLTTSMMIAVEDYLRVAKPEIFRFSR